MGNLNFRENMSRKSNAASKKATRAKVSQSSKANVTFPVGRIARHMRRLRLSDRIGQSASVYMAGVLDYITSEMLEGAGVIAEQKKSNQVKHPIIRPKHIQLSVRSDPEFEKFMSNAQISEGGSIANIHEFLFPAKKGKKAKGTQEM